MCGNGSVDPGEDCDGADLDGEDCTSINQGFDGGALACDACVFDTSGCFMMTCGNDTVEGNEICDGTDIGSDCVAEGFPLGGELGCLQNCSDYDTSLCLTEICGNDAVEGGEICDGMDLDAQDCTTQGFDGGALACAGDCLGFDTSGCFSCGDGIANGNEACDGADLNGATCADFGLGGGPPTCAADCSAVTTDGCTQDLSQQLYVVNDTSPNNSITAYDVAANGALSELAGSPFATGGDSNFNHHPDAIASCGDFIYAANNQSGNIAGFSVDGAGALTAVAGSPFAFGGVVSLACNDGFLFASNFADAVGRFTIGANGALAALGTVPAATSTLGMTLHEGTNRLFVAGWNNNVTVFDINGAGGLAQVPGSPFVTGGSNHSVSVSPSGAFVATEGNNNVRIFSVAGNGSLAPVAGSPFVDNTGCEVVGLAWAPNSQRLFVGHRGCFPGQVSVYDVNGAGALAQVAGSPFQTGGNEAVGLAVDPSGSRLFVSHISDNGTSVLDISPAGALSPVAGSPFANGVGGNHSWLVLRSTGAQSCAFDTSLLPVNVHPGNHFGDLDFDGNCDLVVSGGFDPNLVRVDAQTGVAAALGNFGGVGSVNGVAHRASDNLTYVSTDGGSFLFSVADDGTTVNIMGLPTTMNAIAVTPAGFGVYGNQIMGVGVDGNVHAIDPDNASSQVVGNYGIILSDLGFDATSNTLYIAANDGNLLTMDGAGNVAVFVGGLNGPDGIAVDPGNTVYVAEANIATITAVDIGTGLTSFVGNAQVDGGYYVSGLLRDATGTLLVKVQGANVDFLVP